ncbi:MAG TPA: IclR family transcriptional regulator [Chakrabartia sp.]|jgi:IclR family acetate operon transcriptional repressor|nr:IclR family transcriptional regulator [Chakrabartia sp.]
MAERPAGDSVKSAVRALEILETVVALARPVTAQELAGLLPIPASSLSYLLNTLVNLAYLERSGRTYAAGPSLARLAPSGMVPELREMVRPMVRAIRDQLQETTSFFVEHDFQVEAVVSAVGGQALRYAVDEGQRAPLHAMSAGKAILATFDAARLDAYFAHAPLERFTDKTITDEAALRTELDRVRNTGLARGYEEYSLGIAAMGKAVWRKGAVLGAFAIAIPVARLTRELEARAMEALTRAADMLATKGG